MRKLTRSVHILGIWPKLVTVLRALWLHLQPRNEARRSNELPRENQLSRREALYAAGTSLVTASLATQTRTASAKSLPETKDSSHRWGMVIDLDKCTACGACSVACREENNVPTASFEEAAVGGDIEWMSMIWQEDDDNPDALPQFFPFPCQQCEDPPCVKVCPVGATGKGVDGITYQIWDRCIGCRYCMTACPYSRRSYNWEEPKWEGSLVQLLNPDVATRPAGVVEKCTFCEHRIKRVKEEAALDQRALTDDALMHLPACATACPSKAITFGDLNDPKSSVSKGAQSPRQFRLLEHLGTKPQVYYLKRDKR